MNIRRFLSFNNNVVFGYLTNLGYGELRLAKETKTNVGKMLIYIFSDIVKSTWLEHASGTAGSECTKGRFRSDLNTILPIRAANWTLWTIVQKCDFKVRFLTRSYFVDHFPFSFHFNSGLKSYVYE